MTACGVFDGGRRLVSDLMAAAESLAGLLKWWYHGPIGQAYRCAWDTGRRRIGNEMSGWIWGRSANTGEEKVA